MLRNHRLRRGLPKKKIQNLPKSEELVIPSSSTTPPLPTPQEGPQSVPAQKIQPTTPPPPQVLTEEEAMQEAQKASNKSLRWDSLTLAPFVNVQVLPLQKFQALPPDFNTKLALLPHLTTLELDVQTMSTEDWNRLKALHGERAELKLVWSRYPFGGLL